MKKIELGTQVQDRITGFRGTIVGRTEWETGCTTYCVQSKCDKDGKLPDAEWIDEIRLEVVESPDLAVVPKEEGGPTPRPGRPSLKGR